MTFFVYILKSEKDDRLYIGQTQDIEQRLKFHNTGRSKYTKNLGPWILKATKPCSTRSEAVLLERKLKNLKSRFAIEEFILRHRFNLL